LRRSILDNEERFSLTGADPGCGALALRLVRRAAKRKTLFVINRKMGDPAAGSVISKIIIWRRILRVSGAAWY